MDEKNKYYSYNVDKDVFLNHTVDIPRSEVEPDKGFLDEHPWVVTGGLFGGLLVFGILGTWGTVEWIAHATAKKVVKKMGGSR